MSRARELADLSNVINKGANLQPNLIINSDMAVAQRATSASSVSTGYNTVDRFAIIESNSNATWDETQSTTVPSGQGFAKSWKLSVSSGGSPAANERTIVRQRIEGQNLQVLKKGTASASFLTLSFWVRSSTTGTYICELRDNDNSRAISKSYTIATADTWQKVTLSFAGDTSGALDNDNDASLDVWWWLDAGSNYNSGTLQTSWGRRVDANSAVGQTALGATTNNDWYMTGVSLVVGDSAPVTHPYESYAENLKRCQRYFETNYDQGVALGTVIGNAQQYGIAYRATSGSTNYYSVPLKVIKRSAPAVTIYNGVTGATGTWRGSSSADRSISTGTNVAFINILGPSNNDFIRSGFYAADAEL